MPLLYIITGSNGAGKSTIGPSYIPMHLRESVFDGDKLYMRKRREYWQSGIRSHKECKRLAAIYVEEIFDLKIQEALKTMSDFAYEGHFTNHATWSIPKLFKQKGYKIHLLYLGLSNVNLSKFRVIERARFGGHYVDPITISTNYYGNLEKLNIYFGLFDKVIIQDTSKVNHMALVEIRDGLCYNAIPFNELPNWFVAHLPDISKLVIVYWKNKRTAY